MFLVESIFACSLALIQGSQTKVVCLLYIWNHYAFSLLNSTPWESPSRTTFPVGSSLVRYAGLIQHYTLVNNFFQDFFSILLPYYLIRILLLVACVHCLSLQCAVHLPEVWLYLLSTLLTGVEKHKTLSLYFLSNLILKLTKQFFASSRR